MRKQGGSPALCAEGQQKACSSWPLLGHHSDGRLGCGHLGCLWREGQGRRGGGPSPACGAPGGPVGGAVPGRGHCRPKRSWAWGRGPEGGCGQGVACWEEGDRRAQPGASGTQHRGSGPLNCRGRCHRSPSLPPSPVTAPSSPRGVHGHLHPGSCPQVDSWGIGGQGSSETGSWHVGLSAQSDCGTSRAGAAPGPRHWAQTHLIRHGL